MCTETAVTQENHPVKEAKLSDLSYDSEINMRNNFGLWQKQRYKL